MRYLLFLFFLVAALTARADYMAQDMEVSMLLKNGRTIEGYQSLSGFDPALADSTE